MLCSGIINVRDKHFGTHLSLGIMALDALALSSCMLPKKPRADLAPSVATAIQIDDLENFPLVLQNSTKNCSCAALEACCRYLAPHSQNPITQDTVRMCFDNSEYRAQLAGYGSLDALAHCFNEEFSVEQRGPYHLRFLPATSLEVVEAALLRTARPIILTYNYQAFTPVTTDALNILFSFLPKETATEIIGGEPHVFQNYAHCVLLLRVVVNESGEKVYTIMNPWRGIPLVSTGSSGFEEIAAEEMEERFFKYENPNLLGRRPDKFWKETLKPLFLKLAQPGHYGFFEEVGAQAMR